MHRFARSIAGALITFSIGLPLAQARTLPLGVQPTSRRTLRADVKATAAKRKAPTVISLGGEFRNRALGVRFRYPTNWERALDMPESEGNLTLFVMLLSPAEKNSTVRQNMNLVIEDHASPSMTLQDYTKQGIEKLEDSADFFGLVSSRTTTIAGQPAQRVIFTSQFGATRLKFMQMWFLRRNQAYVWTFADKPETFDTNVGAFEKVLETVIVD